MTDRWYNSLQTADLCIPESFCEEASRYCRDSTLRRRTERGEAPFPRTVDMWFLALCLGAKEGNREDLAGVKVHRFTDGSVLDSDPWRIDALLLLAISLTRDTAILAEPAKIITLANEYAAGGLSDLIDMLRDGDADAMGNLSVNLVAAIKRE